MEHEGFHKRGFTSLWAFFSFVVMVLTGAVMYMAPQGRVAYWVDWHFLGMTKTQWTNIHMVTALAFAGTLVYHLILNWKVFVSYLVSRATAAMEHLFELTLAVTLTCLLLLGAAFSIPPVSYVADLGDYLKSEWVRAKEYEPPFAHAEQLSLYSFARKMDIPVARAAEEFTTHGIAFMGVHESLEDIARANQTSPMELYVLIRKYEPIRDVSEMVYTENMVEEAFAGTGIGRKALPWVIQDLGLDSVGVASRLAPHGIRISDTETLKQAADRYGMEPMDIMKIILVDGYTPSSRR